MIHEILIGGVLIKIKVKGKLENISNFETIDIDTNGIKNKESIIFKDNDIKYTIKFNNSSIILKRETEEFINSFVFTEGKKNNSEYYVKEYKTNIDIEMYTTKIIKTDEYIEIHYQISENNNSFIFTLEMREK